MRSDGLGGSKSPKNPPCTAHKNKPHKSNSMREVHKFKSRQYCRSHQHPDQLKQNIINPIAQDVDGEDPGAKENEKQSSTIRSRDSISVFSNNVPQCRLCWDAEFDEDNPLLQVCKCRGGVEFIHFLCLKNWLKTKEYRQVTMHFTSIYWK